MRSDPSVSKCQLTMFKVSTVLLMLGKQRRYVASGEVIDRHVVSGTIRSSDGYRIDFPARDRLRYSDSASDVEIYCEYMAGAIQLFYAVPGTVLSKARFAQIAKTIERALAQFDIRVYRSDGEKPEFPEHAEIHLMPYEGDLPADP